MLHLVYYILLYSTPVLITPETTEIELKITDLEFVEDKSRVLSFEDIVEPDFQARFNKDLNFVPQDYNTNSAYWVKMKLIVQDSHPGYLLEFFDQTIDSLDIYIRHEDDIEFADYHIGDMMPFQEKPIAHKNFEIKLTRTGNYLVYFRVASHEYADIRVAIRSYGWFVAYALAEYYLYGIFYGMILIISLYNMLIYTAMREVKYLYYTFYILSVGLFALAVDGIGYQYIWRNSPDRKSVV